MMDLSFFDLRPRFSSMEASTATIRVFLEGLRLSVEVFQGTKSTKQEHLACFHLCDNEKQGWIVALEPHKVTKER